MQFTPSQAAAHLKESIASYIESQYRISHPLVFAERSALLRERGVIAQDPFIEATPAFAPARLLRELEEKYPAYVPPGISRLVEHGVPVDRFPLYTHQEEALLASFGDAPNLLVATGTGSGKTEAFVLPILSRILKEARAWSPPKGPPDDGFFNPDDGTWHHSRRHEIREAAVRAIILGAISSQYLPYAAILPAFSALQVEAGRLPAEQRLDAQRKIRLWYWASVFTNRYSGAVESTAAQDYREIKTWYVDDSAEPGLISEFQRDIGNLDLRRETRRGTSVYNGIFNLLVLNGARDWISGNTPQHGDLDDHHIVPKSLGSEYALSTSIDTILNRTPLTSETNREVIRDRLPNEYLPELIATNGKDEVTRILESHFIPARAFDIMMKNPFTASDFEKFIEERGNTLRSRIEGLAGQVGL